MTQVFQPAKPIWCAGCGDFGVQASLVKALAETGTKLSNVVTVAGIGCSGTIQNNIPTYGYHSLHGRTLPAAIGVKLANPQLTVIAAGGDGDGYAIGMGHLIHAFKRNPSILYLIMNNETYGLTKGQYSPTSGLGFEGNVENGMDGIMVGLGVPSTTFLARGFAGAPTQLTKLIKDGLAHVQAGKGFAFVEVLSPCVTYNDTYRLWRNITYDVDSDDSFSPTDRSNAYSTVVNKREEGKIPIGLIYSSEYPSLEKVTVKDLENGPALQDISLASNIEGYAAVMKSFLG
ncbi:MAG: thiamine pyrophosphate-dependent enzyme [Nitrososphaerales archaeon]